MSPIRIWHSQLPNLVQNLCNLHISKWPPNSIFFFISLILGHIEIWDCCLYPCFRVCGNHWCSTKSIRGGGHLGFSRWLPNVQYMRYSLFCLILSVLRIYSQNIGVHNHVSDYEESIGSIQNPFQVVASRIFKMAGKYVSKFPIQTEMSPLRNKGHDYINLHDSMYM